MGFKYIVGAYQIAKEVQMINELGDINQDNNIKFQIIKHQTIPFNIKIRKLIDNVIGSNDNKLISICDRKLGIIFLEIVKKFIGKNVIELIAMHGQTISHINKVKTLQIGNPKYLFKHYKVPIIYDFRTQDIMLGGNGAPLVPYLDWLLSISHPAIVGRRVCPLFF